MRARVHVVCLGSDGEIAPSHELLKKIPGVVTKKNSNYEKFVLKKVRMLYHDVQSLLVVNLYLSTRVDMHCPLVPDYDGMLFLTLACLLLWSNCLSLWQLICGWIRDSWKWNIFFMNHTLLDKLSSLWVWVIFCYTQAARFMKVPPTVCIARTLLMEVVYLWNYTLFASTKQREDLLEMLAGEHINSCIFKKNKKEIWLLIILFNGIKKCFMAHVLIFNLCISGYFLGLLDRAIGQHVHVLAWPSICTHSI